MQGGCGKTIDGIACCLECIIPKMKWDTSMGKQGKTGFDNMPMFSFNCTFLLVSVWARDVMCDATICKIVGERAVFAALI